MIKRIKWIFSGVLGGLFVIVLIALIINTVSLSKNQMGNFFGYTLSYVPTNSMEPTIEPGDTVLIKKGNIEDASVGDIIVYYDGTRYIIHRIILINEDKSLTTKGDNNPVSDTIKITSENYYGKYVKTVNYLNLQSLVKNRNYIFPICIIIFLGILLSEGISIAKSISKNREEKIQELEKEKIKQELLEEIKKEIQEENKN